MDGGFGYPLRNIIMNRIWNVFVDSGEKVYVTDRNLARVTSWPPNIKAGVTNGTIISNGVGIWGIDFGQYGHLNTSSFDAHVIRRNNATVIIGQHNVTGNSSTHLNGPRGIFFDKNSSSVFVCDSLNHRIQKLRMNNSMGVPGEQNTGKKKSPFSSPDATSYLVFVSKSPST